MNLESLSKRPDVAATWLGGKLPWHEPAFSERMLQEHLSQDHDAASRRSEIIDAHVAWIHEAVLGGEPSRVLDLGCGPGLYTNRLAAVGHRTVGIDVSPAAIRHARTTAAVARLACDYRQHDFTEAELDEGFDLVMCLFGEPNTFTRKDMDHTLAKARAALAPTGRLLLEVHTSAQVRGAGEGADTWHAADRGLFGDSPHLVLAEAAWWPDRRAAAQWWWVVDLAAADVTRHVSTTYDHDWNALLAKAGFDAEEWWPGFPGSPEPEGGHMPLVLAAPAAR